MGGAARLGRWALLADLRARVGIAEAPAGEAAPAEAEAEAGGALGWEEVEDRLRWRELGLLPAKRSVLNDAVAGLLDQGRLEEAEEVRWREEGGREEGRAEGGGGSCQINA